MPPLFMLESAKVSCHRLSEQQLPPDVAYQVIHDELMLDGNARLNVATFVTSWMDPQAEKLRRPKSKTEGHPTPATHDPDASSVRSAAWSHRVSADFDRTRLVTERPATEG